MSRCFSGTNSSRGTASIASIILISVTSLGRTWLSTIFWRAVENPDIGGTLPNRAGAARGKNFGIFGTGFAKTQHADGAGQSLAQAFAIASQLARFGIRSIRS